MGGGGGGGGGPPQQQQQQQQLHGLAATIRAATESETFDLGGLATSTIQTVVAQAFDQPYEGLTEMIRITLVVGAGKQGRQKYPATALKVVTSTLQSVGLVEDRGASGVWDCAGQYKFQHDTGKNLKTVVIYPKVVVRNDEGGNDGNQGGGGGGGANASSGANTSSLLPSGSLESKVASASLAVFRNMVPSKCSTWSQKRALLALLDDDIIAILTECDNLLMKGQPLSDAQQSFYDATTAVSDKRTYLQDELQAHIERGDLTKSEVEGLLEQVQQRMAESSSSSSSTAVSANKLKERQSKLKEIAKSPTGIAKLKHHAALGKLWKQLQPLQHLDEHSNKLLSVQETRGLGQKVDLLEQIHDLEQASKGWLEDDAVFETRLAAARREFQLKFGINSSSSSGRGKKSASSARNTISATTKVRVPVTKWVTPMGGGFESSHKKASTAAKKKARLNKGDVFGAMMATSSDDEDSDDDDDERHVEDQNSEDEEEQASTPAASEPSKPTKSSSNNTKKKKNKKKGKNKKGGGGGGGFATGKDDDDEALLEATAAAVKMQQQKTKVKEAEEVEEGGALAVGFGLVQEYIIPLLLGILTWLVGMLFGTKKSKAKQTKKKA